MTSTANRREFIAAASAVTALSALRGNGALAQESMPRRPIPSTGETLPIVGLGSSKVVSEVSENGTEPLAAVLRALRARGGSVIDTWSRDATDDAGLGRVLAEADLRDSLFVTTKVHLQGREAGIGQFRQTQEHYGRQTLDLAQIMSLTDLDTHWPSLRDWKSAGDTRYIGVTVSNYDLYEPLEAFLQRETPDFIQINYSISERRAEERLLPLAADMGLAVLINRPFMNGFYFDALEGVPLPGWTAGFDCTSWAQFSLKYIIAHPPVTCVLTETSNPAHMTENAGTAFGPLPGESAKARMREYIDSI